MYSIDAICFAASTRTRIGIRSGPLAFQVFSLLSSFSIPSVVNVMFGIDEYRLVPLSGELDGSSCVNTDYYCLFSASAFALLSLAKPPSVFRVGIPPLSFF